MPVKVIRGRSSCRGASMARISGTSSTKWIPFNNVSPTKHSIRTSYVHLLNKKRNRIHLFLSKRLLKPSHLLRDFIEPSRGEPAPEVSETRYHDSRNRHSDIRPRLIENEEFQAAGFGDIDAG